MNNITSLSGQLNTSCVKSEEMLGKTKTNVNAIAEVTGRIGVASLDLYLTSSPPAGIATPLLGAAQTLFGLVSILHNYVEEDESKISTLKRAGDVVSGVGVLSGCMPATIAGVAMTSIGTLLSLNNNYSN